MQHAPGSRSRPVPPPCITKTGCELYTTPTDIIRWIPLASRVLVVASIDTEHGTWSAFIDAVAGKNHENEFMDVLVRGKRMSEIVAISIFPDLARYSYRE